MCWILSGSADTPAPEKTLPNHFTSGAHIVDFDSLRVTPFSLALSSMAAMFLLCSPSLAPYTSRLSWMVMHPSSPANTLVTSWWKMPELLVGPKNSLFILYSPRCDWNTTWLSAWRGTWWNPLPMSNSLKTLAPLSWCLASCGVITWYLVCLAPLLYGLASMFILIFPCAFFSEMARLRMQSTASAGLTLTMTPSFSSFVRCCSSLSW